MRFGYVLVPALALAAGASVAQEANPPAVDMRAVERRANAEDDRGTLTLLYENDKLGGTDRQYTNGFQLGYLSSTAAVPEWLHGLRPSLVPALDDDGAIRFGVSLGQNLYTPDDTSRRAPVSGDRPYAAWTYMSFSLLTDTGFRLDTLALDLGLVGPAALGEQVQNSVHRLIGVDNADGWDNQIENEPGLNLVWERKWRMGRQFGLGGFGVDMTPHVGASLGNVFTYAGSGVAFRIGHDLPSDYGPPRIRPSLAGSNFFQPTAGWGWYLFAGVEGRAIARDITLDGNSLRQGRPVEKEPLVGDLQFGFAVTWEAVRLAFTYDMRTREFEGQGENVAFGAIGLSTRF